MRVSVIATTLFAAAAAQAASIPPRAYIVNLPERQTAAAPAVQERADFAAQAASHAQARRSGSHSLPQRRLIRRRKAAGSCRPKSRPSTEQGKLHPTSSHSSSDAQTSSSDWNDASSKSWGESSTSTKAWGESSSAASSTAWDESATASSSAAWGEPSSSSSEHHGHHSESASASASESASATEGHHSASASPKPSDLPDATGPSTGHPGMSHTLMPIGAGIAGWTTCPESNEYGNYLSYDQALLPLQAGKLPEQTTAPDGSNCHVNKYPAGVVGGKGGFMFYTQGSTNGVNVESAKEIIMSYAVWFADGFDWKAGGKLPGIYGGISAEAAKSCSGGRQDDSCFSVRPMWRENGQGEFYDYVGPQSRAINNWCDRPRYFCNSNYGDSIERGAFSFKTGQWNAVAIRVKKNDPGQANGSQELFINGESVIVVNDVSYSTMNVNLYGLMGQTFFGGSDVSKYAPSSEQTAYFKDWTLIVTQ